MWYCKTDMVGVDRRSSECVTSLLRIPICKTMSKRKASRIVTLSRSYHKGQNSLESAFLWPPFRPPLTSKHSCHFWAALNGWFISDGGQQTLFSEFQQTLWSMSYLKTGTLTSPNLLYFEKKNNKKVSNFSIWIY